MDTEKILERYKTAKVRRQKYENTLRQISDFVWPDVANIVTQFYSDNEGQVNTVTKFDSTANMAAYKMASGIFSNLMPVGTRWFNLKPKKKDYKSNNAIMKWLSTATDTVHEEIWRSNYQLEMFATIRSICVLGTGIISVVKDGTDLIFRSHPIGRVFFEENSKGIIDTVYVILWYTARQAVQEFGEKNVSKKILDAAKDDSKTNDTFEYVHAVYPNGDFAMGKRFGKKKYASAYIEVDEKKIAKKEGFNEMPYLIGRFTKYPGEIMGRCPSFELLPEIKMLDKMKEVFIESSEKAANPPLIADDDSIVGQPATGISDMIYKRPEAMMPQPLNVGINVQLNAELIAQQQKVIKDGYFNDLFSALSEYRNMTAFEVSKRIEESFVLLSPAIKGQEKELHDPIVQRVLNLLISMEKIDPPPIAGLEFDIVYQGRLSLAMENMQAGAIEINLAKWSPYVQLSPVLDNVDMDEAFRQSWLSSGAPADMLVDPEEITAMREAMAQKKEMAETASIADTASKAYKNASVAAEDNSLAGAMM